ncbi:MAG: response regulator [Myxococcales bacterium]|jgi:CheY-like chemotaxis protein
MRILVVEDSVTMRKVMEMTFAGEDAELLAVESGELALERGQGFGPDVAFVDASLPGIDGYEVTRAMKSDPQLSGTAVILMASQHRPLDAARAAEVGADDHILKPFDTQEAIEKANALAAASETFYEAASIPVARPATTPPRPVVQPSRRPTPPPLPIGGASARPMAAPAPVSRGSMSGASVSSVAPVAASSAPPSQPAAASSGPSSAPSSSIPMGAVGAAHAAASDSVVERLQTLGLTPDQVEGVLRLSAEVVERVVWEVVPTLAEAMIREELHRLVGD